MIGHPFHYNALSWLIRMLGIVSACSKVGDKYKFHILVSMVFFGINGPWLCFEPPPEMLQLFAIAL